MGSGHWDPNAFSSYATSRGYASKSAAAVTNTDPTRVNQDFLPINFKNGLRESRDSTDNPVTTPIVIGGDVTGSMGQIAGLIIKEQLNKLLTDVLDRKPVEGPQIMVMAIGDALVGDRFPIQGTQFESDLRIVQQLEELFVEGGGGGNNNESYSLAYAVAGLMTQHDSWEKRSRKGVLFTYGDELPTSPIPKGRIKDLLGVHIQSDALTIEDALALASRTYDVYHLVIEQGDYARRCGPIVIQTWRKLLGQNAISVTDYTELPAIITSILQIRGGADKAAVVGSWSGTTAVAVANAVGTLSPTTSTPKSGVVAV